MTQILQFPVSEKIYELMDISDVTILPITLQFREHQYGMYCDYSPHNPKAKQMLKLMRKRNVQYHDLQDMEDMGFVVEIVYT